ncbi:MAG: hypothetical protein COW08_05790 [Ignavibacteriales bacterium CG12_big_fil_rev_8_21_14_0_65_30_8]|nr:MAG: hypothetical protein COW08_05790 [Ignavibacteriales bacterium CG12_big_fil_rev_8_21_14_0_65_30_8]
MSTSIDYLSKSVGRYLQYVKGFDKDQFEINGFPVNLNSFVKNSDLNLQLNNLAELIKSVSSDKKISIYSLQNNFDAKYARKYWRVKTFCFFKNKDFKKTFVILFNSGKDVFEDSNKFFNENNAKNAEYCHSMLFRDFVKKHKIGFEIDLSLSIKKDGNEDSDFRSHLTLKNSTLELNNSISFKENLISDIIKNFNDYFPKASLKRNIYEKYLTDFYAYNINCKAFKAIDNSVKIVDDIILSDVDTGHELYGSAENEMKKEPNEQKKDISMLSKWLIYVNVLSDFTRLIVHYKKIEKPLKILLIDDHPEKLEKEFKIIENWLTNCTINNKDNKLISKDSIEKYFGEIENGDSSLLKIGLNNCESNYDLMLIDLDYEGELRGFDYLRILRKVKSVYEPPFIVVFSRNEDAASVQKALNMGALFFASKQNFAHLLLQFYKVLPHIKQLEIIAGRKDKNYTLGNNWSLLYKLSLPKILELRGKEILGDGYFVGCKETGETKFDDDKIVGFDKNKIEKNPEYLWIKKLPKAELHIHIGSVLGPELIPKTALLVLAQKYAKDKKYGNIETIIKFLLPVASDPFLFEKIDKITEVPTAVEKINIFECNELKLSLIYDLESQYIYQSIFTIVTDSLNLKEFKKTPEEVLLSPEDRTLEQIFHPLSKIKDTEYFKAKLKLRELCVSYDEVMLFFILLLYCRWELVTNPQKDTNSISLLTNYIKKVFDKEKDPIFKYPEDDIDSFIKNLLLILAKNNAIKVEFFPPVKGDSENILHFLMSAHSPRRCLPFEGRGLFNYLRGCEYGGAPHLQCKESIFLIAHHIVKNYAIPENIRYLDLRCAVDGYTKFKLIKNTSKAVEILENAFSFWQNYALKYYHKKVHVNLIVTAKRHKPIKEFEENVKLTVDGWINNDSKAMGKEPKNKDELDSTNKNFFSEQNPTKIVSFDIAGLEKNNRVSKFKNELKPLLDRCIPITMHAGEDDTHEAIWEAVYLAHAQRLGHALTLEDNKSLLDLVRETYVNVELCPISNFLTNNKFSFDKELIKQDIRKEYPLKKYLRERISVSINTDNPYVSDSDLSKEFLFAAKISNGLTKWEILKLILYSFKAITLDKRQKSELLKEINEEIFELMLNEDNY